MSEIRIYFKERTKVLAVQYTGENLWTISNFVGRHPEFKELSFVEYEKIVESFGFKIVSGKNSYIINIGDYIVKDKRGTFSIYTEEQFNILFRLFENPQVMEFCSECSSQNIEALYWVNINTRKVGDIYDGDHPIKVYCNDCEEFIDTTIVVE